MRSISTARRERLSEAPVAPVPAVPAVPKGAPSETETVMEGERWEWAPSESPRAMEDWVGFGWW